MRLEVLAEAVGEVAADIGTDDVLVEEMAVGGVAELLVGVTRDPAHGFVLTLGAGGVLTEILRDTVSLLIPSSRDAVKEALSSLNCAPLLAGYRGKPAAEIEAILDAVDAVQAYVIANASHVSEVEINPLICTPNRAIAVDAPDPKGKYMNPVKTKRDGAILEVTLDRPKANAIDLATSRVMGEVFRDFRDDPDLRVAILTGVARSSFAPAGI